MNEITLIGLDLAKNVFHLIGLDSRGKEVKKRMLRRKQMLHIFAQLPTCTVAIEACAGAHYWARELEKLGHCVKVIPAQYVKPYLQGNKNDYNDARAIAEAAQRPSMRSVGIKSVEQQDIQALHRLRQQQVQMHTALCNQLRALTAEYGLVLPKGTHALHRGIPALLEDAENGLSERFRVWLHHGYEQLVALQEHIDYYTREIKEYARREPAIQRLETIPGFGPIVASAFVSHVGDGRQFAKGRDVSASIGLVPRQHSSGGKDRLLGISKRGDRQLRSLLVHGARSVVRHAKCKEDRLSRWVNRLCERRGINKATVALANKLARIAWSVLRNKTTYRPA